jgi:hypothetical protein
MRRIFLKFCCNIPTFGNVSGNFGRVRAIFHEASGHTDFHRALATTSVYGTGLLLLTSTLTAIWLPGTDVMIFYIFSPKNFAKKLAFLTQNEAKFLKKVDHNIGV